MKKSSLNFLPLPPCSSSLAPETLIVDLASMILSSFLSIWTTPSPHDGLFPQVPFGFRACTWCGMRKHYFMAFSRNYRRMLNREGKIVFTFESSPASSALPCLASPPSPTQLCWRTRISTHQLPLLCSLSCSPSSSSSGSCNGLEAAASRTGCPADSSLLVWQQVETSSLLMNLLQ